MNVYKIIESKKRHVIFVGLLVVAIALGLAGCRSVSAGVDNTVVITVTGNVQELGENSLTIGGVTYTVLVSDLLDGIEVGDRVIITGSPNSNGGLFVTDVSLAEE